MSAKWEVIKTPLAQKFVESLDGPLKDDYVRINPSGCVMPAKFTKDVQKILDFEVKPDDVWLVTLPKCGTTWSQEMIWLLMNDLNFEKAKEIPLIVRFPFLEVTSFLPDFTKGQPHSIEVTQKLDSPRLIKSHLPLDLLPRQIKTVKPKIIYVMRNLRDVIVSYYHHYQLWSDCNLSLDEFAECFMEDLPMYLPFWDHAVPFWNIRQEPNVLFYMFEEMKTDLGSVVRRAANFLGRPVTEEQVTKLLDHLSFEKMQQNPAVNYENIVEQIREDNSLRSARSAGKTFMRRGDVGEGKQRLSDEMQQRLQRWSDACLQGQGYTGPR